VLRRTLTSDFSRKADYGFLEDVVEVGGDKPATGQRFTHLTEILTVRIKFFWGARDIATLTALNVGVL